MSTAMNELRRQNQTLEDNIFNIQQYQHAATPTKDIEVLDF